MGRLCVIGGGHASTELIRRLREGNFPDAIDVYEESSHFPYERPFLSKEGLQAEHDVGSHTLVSETALNKLGVNFRRESRVSRLSMVGDKFEVEQTSGAKEIYEQVVVASGVAARTLKLEGLPEASIYYLQSLDDLLQLKNQLKSRKQILIIGAGFIGLEVASSLRHQGHEVQVIEQGTQIMNRVLSEFSASQFQTEHNNMGTKIHLQTGIQSIVQNLETGEFRVCLTSGETFSSELILASIGVEPVTAFIDIPVEMEGKHIIVNHVGQTSVKNLYAIGDVAARPNPANSKTLVKIQSIDGAVISAKRLAGFILGQEIAAYESWVPKFWSDQASQSLNIAGLRSEGDQQVLRGEIGGSKFIVGFFRDENLIAVEAVNSPIDFSQAVKIIQGRIKISPSEFSDTGFVLKSLTISSQVVK